MTGLLLTDALCERVRAARRVLVLTGSGVSAESGVPTFRDAQTGLWARYRPEALATPEAFARDPGLVWRWYQWRRQLVTRAEPNSAHRALVRWQALRPELVVVTQNVDGLHRRAGTRNLVELHGALDRYKCSRDQQPLDLAALQDSHVPPACPRCGAAVRPDVVWFGEILPQAELAAAHSAVQRCDLMLVVGTSGQVYPAAELPAMALDRGIPVVEVNPAETPLARSATHWLRAGAGTALPALVGCLADPGGPPG